MQNLSYKEKSRNTCAIFSLESLSLEYTLVFIDLIAKGLEVTLSMPPTSSADSLPQGV